MPERDISRTPRERGLEKERDRFAEWAKIFAAISVLEMVYILYLVS